MNVTAARTARPFRLPVRRGIAAIVVMWFVHSMVWSTAWMLVRRYPALAWVVLGFLAVCVLLWAARRARRV